MTTPTTTIRDAIRAAHARSGLTITEAAGRALLTRSQLSSYLAGKRDLNGATLDRLMSVYGLRVVRLRRGGERLRRLNRTTPGDELL